MKPAVIFLAFTASWCQPCRQFKQDFGAEPDVRVIDISDDRSIAEAYGIATVPTVIRLEDGVEAGRTVGYKGKAAMRRWMMKRQ